MLFTTATIGDFFEQQVQKAPDREFIVYPDRGLRFTYRQFNERVNQLAKGLLAIGLNKGDNIGIWATNVPDWLTFMFATAKIGAVLVTVNTSYKSHELSYVIKQSDMKAIAIINQYRDVSYIDTLYELVPELRTDQRGSLHSRAFPLLKNAIHIGREKYQGMYNMDELILLGQQCNDDDLLRVKAAVQSDDVVNIQYTSGTTGFPKGVMLTHKNILNNGFFIGERQKLTEQDRLCLPVPLFHCFGCVLGVLALLTHGGTLVMVENFDPLLVLDAVQKEKCTALYGVPTMFIKELSHQMFNTFDLSSLRTGIMAGSPCPIETMKKVISDMHCDQITIAYGLTEASPVITQTSTDDTLERRVGTVGTALPDIEVKIAAPAGEAVGINQQGELCCRGYNVMKGYYNMPQETRQAIDAEGWLHSGDLATCDEHGYYRITGRIKDMIIRGGENIYPREIEEFLYTMPGIQSAQVVGMPDKEYGEVVGAFVILEDDAVLTAQQIQDFARTKIARYKVPKHIFILDKYPMTASGKVQKFKLREMTKKLLKIQDDGFIHQ